MQGIFINSRRPKSKKEVKEAILADPTRVYAEATSFFGNEYDGPISEMPDNTRIDFVGPDPSRLRNFYGNIFKTNGKLTVK